MLLRFTVENLFCFAEETVFSMVATKDEQHPEHAQLLRDGYPHKALSIAALYGANAHGKTKLVKAISFARKLILEGRKPGQSIPVEPFRLDEEKRGQPSRCEFVIFHENVEYTYGFLATTKRIVEEWLFARPSDKEECYFERVTDTEGKTQVSLGIAFQGIKEDKFIEYVARGTRENQLFLTKAMDDNVSVVKPVYEWFSHILTVVSTDTEIQPIALRAIEANFVEFMSCFLRLADTGIDSIITEEENLDYERFFPDTNDAVSNDVENDLAKGMAIGILNSDGLAMAIRPSENGHMLVRLKTLHRDKHGVCVPFDIEEESAGTQRVMQILPILAELKASKGVFIIDELDRKLHPLLSRLFIETYLEMGKGQNCQLIFTTHETSLLNLDLLRRDEIWFVEKDRKGASQVYSLADFDFKPNSDVKLELGYLHGRFGGIPFIGDIRSLGWIDD